MGKQRKVNAPFQMLACDLMEFPRSSSGFKYLVVTTDFYSNFTWLRPLRRAEAKTEIARFLEDVFLKYEVPGVLVCDNGPQFKSAEMRQFCKKYGVRLLLSYP